MAFHIKRVLYSSVIALSVFSAGSAYCQSATEPKLTLGNINFYNGTPDGFYTVNVGLNLIRGPNNPQVNFNITLQHVRSLDEAYDKLKPAIDDLAKELKQASDNFHPPH